MAHGIFRGDNVTSITDPAKIRTIVTYGDIDNGAPITLGGLVADANEKYYGEAEVFTTSAATGANAEDVWVVTTPEIDYEKYALADFYNKSGAIGRAIAMEKYDIFSVTSEVLSKVPSANDKYLAATNEGWTVSNASSKAFATYLGSDVQDGVTFYAFQVL